MTSCYQHSRAAAALQGGSQESCLVFERGDFVVVLADGGGGMRAGAAASRSLVAVVEWALNDSAFRPEDLDAWAQLFRQVHSALVATGAGETTGMVVVAGPHGVLGLSTGNSEAWLVTPTAIDDLTVGQHTRHRLGRQPAPLTTFQRPALQGVLVVASDGLFKFAARAVIADVVRAMPVHRAADSLVELVNLRSGKVAEDVTVVLMAQAEIPIPS